MPIVLDTHAWVWWVAEDKRLSARAAQAIQRAAGAGEVTISAISIWEVAKKVEKKQVVLDRPLRDWLDRATSVKGLFVTELTPSILIESCDLPQPFHGDPADQLIVASARHHQATLISRDRNIRHYPHVKTVW
jgi:PIN domain nuclease of toxin-antitoxin system